MSKLVILIDQAIASAAKQQKRLKRTIRKHVVQAVVEQSTGRTDLTEAGVLNMLDGKLGIDPQTAIILAKALNLTAREILDAQTDDQLASVGDTTSRGAAAGTPPAKGASTAPAKPATRTSPAAPAARRREIIEKIL